MARKWPVAAVTPELDAGGAHEYRTHRACGAEQQGWPDTGRDYTSAESVIFHSDESLQSRVSGGEGVQTCCPDLYYLARAVITKDHTLSSLSNRNLFSHKSGYWKSKTKESAGLASSEISLLGLLMAISSSCLPHVVFPVPLCILISSNKDTSHNGLGTILMIPF